MHDTQEATDLDSRVLHAVHEAGSLTFDKLLAGLGPYGFAPVFAVVDRLTRRGVLRMDRVGREYELRPAVTWQDAMEALQDAGMLGLAVAADFPSHPSR